MLLVFCGTPSFAVPTLEKLVKAGHSVPLVVTQPDRPRGRGMDVAVSPVKDAATRLGIAVLQPGTIKNNVEFRDELTAIRPDAIIVVGYGRIIPQWMIDLPRLGNLNLHASLLPKYRGAAPIQWAIANGESVTGVTTMRIDAGLDTGDILMQREIVDWLGRYNRDVGPEAGVHRRGSDGRDPARTRDRASSPNSAGSCASHARADSEKRRWPHGLLSFGKRRVQPPARFSALAWGVHDL